MSALARLALIEVLDAEGRVTHAFDVTAWPVRLGRALDNEFVLHDPQVAAHHATLEVDGAGALTLRVGNSRNGARIERGRSLVPLAAGEQATLEPLARWQLGASMLRVRRLHDPLPEEAAQAGLAQQAPRWLLPALAAAALAWVGITLWLSNNPDSGWEDYVPALLSAVGGLAVWGLLWGLASKLFTHRFVFTPHLRLALGFSLAMLASELVLSMLAFALDWPWASRARPLVLLALGAALVARHLRLVLPLAWRHVRAVVVVLAVLSAAVQMATQWQRNERLVDELYASTLLPPAWRLVGAQAPQTLVQELRALEKPLRESARKAAEKDFEP